MEWIGLRRRALALIAFAIVALVANGCADEAAHPPAAGAPQPPTATPPPAEPGTPAGSPVTVTDSGGQAFVFDSPPQRIISHSPGATEILFAIGAGAQVIAVDEFSDYPPETADLERVAYSDPDPERALALDPDLVIFAGRQQGSLEQFRALGLPVFYNSEPESVEGVLENILLLGSVTGRSADAEALVAEMQGRIDAILAAIEDVESGPRVFWELTDDLYTVAPDTFIGAMLSMLKAENIAAGAATRFPQLTNEAVIDADPQAILLADGEWVPVESVGARPGWDAIDAVRAGRVFPVDPDTGSRPGPRIVEAMEAIARLLYPDRFE